MVKIMEWAALLLLSLACVALFYASSSVGIVHQQNNFYTGFIAAMRNINCAMDLSWKPNVWKFIYCVQFRNATVATKLLVDLQEF